MWLRLILGGVYVGMAAGQAISWAAMPDILAAYQVGGAGPMRVLAAALICGELACGLWFVARPRSTALTPVWVYTAMTLIWAGLGGQAVIRRLEYATPPNTSTS